MPIQDQTTDSCAERRRLLRPRSDRPCRRAAEKRDDEVAASKPIEPIATDLGAQQRTPLLPIPVREQVQQNAPRLSTYSMISSASASSVGGISRPSAFAVFTC
jgi:hypothetical protein